MGSKNKNDSTDKELIKRAFTTLTALGVADLLGKYTALLDWKVTHLVAKEYICDRVVEIEEETMKNKKFKSISTTKIIGILHNN